MPLTNCKNCIFFSLSHPLTAIIGKCRRHPPVVIGVDSEDYFCVYPDTTADSGCGDGEETPTLPESFPKGSDTPRHAETAKVVESFPPWGQGPAIPGPAWARYSNKSDSLESFPQVVTNVVAMRSGIGPYFPRPN